MLPSHRRKRSLLGIASVAGIVAGSAAACASRGGPSWTPAPSDTGGFVVDGDPASDRGARWTFRGRVDGVVYDLSGVLMKPTGLGPFPAVLLSHGFEGNAALLASQVGRTMVGWGLVVIAPNYTHSTGVPIGAPGGADDPAGSDANVLRAHMTYELLRRLGYVDLSRVALHGHSMGAWVSTAVAARYPAEFRVASTTGGGIRSDRRVRGPAPTSDEARGVRIPFQLHHGDADETVPFDFDARFATLLSDHGVPNELYRYRGGHLAPRSSPEMLARVHAWYARFGMFDH